VQRYKKTNNGGRAIVFLQIGVPLIADAIPEVVEIVRAHELGLVVEHPDQWLSAVEILAQSFQLRRYFSKRALSFSREHLTTRAEGMKILQHISCYNRLRFF